jgi:hypothetical protein
MPLGVKIHDKKGGIADEIETAKPIVELNPIQDRKNLLTTRLLKVKVKGMEIAVPLDKVAGLAILKNMAKNLKELFRKEPIERKPVARKAPRKDRFHLKKVF